MRQRIRRTRKRAKRLAAAVLALAAVVFALAAWQIADAQQPPSGTQIEWVNEDEDWIERKKHGQFRARPIFSQQLTTLYYGIRDADTGEWLTSMYRVSGGETARDEGWEYEFDYPALDEQTPLDPDRTYLMVMLAATGRQPTPTTFYAVVPLHQPGGLLGSLLRALDPDGWAKAAARWVIEGVHGTLCGVLTALTAEEPVSCRDEE
ncbi:MAG: hypothetical protein OXS30_07860 [Chloroflexota bacterium]|nr:hypothetical protein [Chloroflexota bacterium]